MMTTGILPLPLRGDEAPLLLCEAELLNARGVCSPLFDMLATEVLDRSDELREVI
jgi:hypothetical protein